MLRFLNDIFRYKKPVLRNKFVLSDSLSGICSDDFIPYDRKFKIGQRVYVYYFVIYGGLFADALFNPPMAGIIVGTPKLMMYHHFTGKIICGNPDAQTPYGLCWVYIIKTSDGRLIEYPECCMMDLDEHIKSTEAFLECDAHRIGDPGYSLETYNQLLRNLNNAKLFSER